MNNSTEQADVPADAPVAVPPSAASTSSEPQARKTLKRQQALVAMGRRVIAPPESSILIHDAAALLAETLDAEYGGAAEFSPDGKSLRLQLTTRKTDAGESGTVTHETGTAGADSLAGYVLEVARPVVVEDLVKEERFEDLFLRMHGVKSAIAVPLMLMDRSFGSLAVYTDQDRRFDEEDVLFAETVAHMVSATIARTQAETSLEDERRQATGVLQTVDAMVLKLDVKWRIVSINPACERLTGFSLEEIKDRAVWNVFSVPEEGEISGQILQKLCKSTSPVECESYLLTKHSQRRQIAWSYSASSKEDGTLKSILATGIDITEQREAEQRAEQAEQAAEETRQKLAELKADDDETDNTDSVPNGSQAAATEENKETVEEARELEKHANSRVPPTPNLSERRRQPRRSFPYT